MLVGVVVYVAANVCSEKDVVTQGRRVKVASLPIHCTELRYRTKAPTAPALELLFAHFSSLKHKSPLVLLDFRTVHLDSNALTALLKWLVKQQPKLAIETLLLDETAFNHAQWVLLCAVVKDSRSLRILGLEGTGMDPDRAELLAVAIRGAGKSVLQRVGLANNELGPGGALALARAHGAVCGGSIATATTAGNGKKRRILDLAHPAVYAALHRDEEKEARRLSGKKAKKRTEVPPLHTEVLPLLEYCGVEDARGLAAQFADIGAADAYHLAEIDPSVLAELGLSPMRHLSAVRCICTNYLHEVQGARLKSSRKARELADRYVAALCRPLFVDLHGRFAKDARAARASKKATTAYHGVIEARIQEALRERAEEEEAAAAAAGEGKGEWKGQEL